MDGLFGQRFGRLIVTADLGRQGHNRLWMCRCDCGSHTAVLASNLKRGNTASCGCLHRERTAASHLIHGHAAGEKPTPEYTAHQAMLSRCYNPKNISYQYYGPKGITVCARWRIGEGGNGGFECFLADMGRRPGRKYSIERKDGSLGYSAANCCWATAKEQSANTSRNHWVECMGQRVILADAIRMKGLKHSTVMQRLGRGWTVERALETVAAP